MGKGAHIVRGAVLAAALSALALAVLVAPRGALAADGSISGTVTDASTHAGIEEIDVCAWGQEIEDSQCWRTGSDGGYTLAGLDPGKYAVEFSSQWLNYVGEWYDDKSFSEVPDLVTVTSGSDTPGIDAALERGGTIAGTVVDNGLAKEPLAGIDVIAFQLDGEFVSEDGTDSNGEYSIERLPAGTYKVQFWSCCEQNYVTQYYDGKDSWAAAEPVSVDAGESTSNVDAEMQAGGTISGRITEAEHGSPLWATACLMDAATEAFLRCRGPNVNGNLNGEYEFDHLASGTYKVVFSPEFHDWFPEEEPDPDGYETQFYDAKASFAAADPIVLVAPADVTGVNASLTRSPEPFAPALIPPVASTGPPAVQFHPRPKTCRRGWKRKRVRGKVRCVRIRHDKRKHRRHAH